MKTHFSFGAEESERDPPPAPPAAASVGTDPATAAVEGKGGTSARGARLSERLRATHTDFDTQLSRVKPKCLN